VALAAWIMGIPVVLHESDTVPGLANRIVAKFSRTVFLGFEEAKRFFPHASTAVVGQMLSPVYLDTPKEPKHYDSSRPARLLVQCGSQGSSRIFDRLLSIPELASRFDVTVLLGTKNESYREAFETAGMRAVEFVPPEELVHLYEWADIAVTRGSATILAEFALFDVRMCIVPLPETGGDHQTANARIYEQLGHLRMAQSEFLDPATDLLTALETLVYRSVHEDIRSRSAYDVIDGIMASLLRS
jgi:UDP-N-acetylglucosamine--N-acetylmuramyl-(pentapeptide) pyrophosphoryl-undecaprenol N-acetylglucosamine transferase